MPEPIAPADSIEVVPVSDGGNGLPPDSTPPSPTPATPPAEPAATPAVPATPAEPTSELYELPDGRKVDGATVAQEYKNLLGDYTRKSQALAAKDTPPAPTAPLQPNTATSPQDDPNWIPQSYHELIKVAEERALKAIEGKEAARQAERQAVEDAISGQLTELKTADPTLNENALFFHATKYRFPDLKTAYANMKDMSEMAKKVQQTTATNIQKRNDPVSASPGATGTRPEASSFQTAREYLRSLQP